MTDSSYLEYLNSWHEENKPRVLMFDVASNIPLLYKVSVYYMNCLNSMPFKSVLDTESLVRSSPRLPIKTM